MSFEDDMIEDGFHDEQDYLDYLCYEADRMSERMRDSDDFDNGSYRKSSYRSHFSNLDERTRRGLMLKGSNGCFNQTDSIRRRNGSYPLKAGHFVYGPRFNYIDMDNAIIIPEQYDQVEYFRGGLARCHKGNRWVLINESCEELPLSENESIESTFVLDGKLFYCVKRQLYNSFRLGGPEGLIDQDGNVLLPTIFKFIEVKNGCFVLTYDNETFNAPGKKTFTVENLLAIVKGPSGFLDWEKDSWPKAIIPFVDGVRAIRRNEKWGFEKENGELVIECKYLSVNYFRKYYDHYVFGEERKMLRTRMLAIVENDWCSGCIDMSGEVVFHIRDNVRLSSTKPKYPYFRESDNKLWAEYCDLSDDLIRNDSADVQVDGSLIMHGIKVPAGYDWGLECGDFINVIKDGLWGIIDKEGKEIIPCKYDDIFDYSLDDYNNNNLLILKKNGKYGKVNNKGEEVVPFIYDDYNSLPQE